MKISDIGEFGMIAQIAEKFKSLIPKGCRGIGDDCAVIPISATQSMVITADMLVEDVHFLRDHITPYELGYKSLAVNLSDIASMGAEAHSSFLSIALPSSISAEWCSDFFDGYRSHNVALLGGDTTKSTDKIAINITVIGIVDNDKIKLRSGAKEGDKIYVTATLGDSAGGLRSILDSVSESYPELVKQHNTPRPHLTEAKVLSNLTEVNSMMDISDGLASDLCHILRASNVGAEIELSKIPISEELKNSQWDAMKLALTGGEDYCLLFTASEGFAAPDGVKIFEIGVITKENIGKVIWLANGAVKNLNYKGFTHF